MQVVVKTPRIDIKIKGDVPKNLLLVLKKDFGEKLMVSEDTEEQLEIFKTVWYLDTAKNDTAGKALWVYRDNAGLTQRQLSDKTGIAIPHISEMENDKRVIGKKNAKKLAKILKCDYRVFL